MVVSANEEMGKSARHVESASELGTKHLSDLLDKTHQTEDMTRSMMHKVDGLKETTSSVVKVLDVLQNITKQTNILSLNATIEAPVLGRLVKALWSWPMRSANWQTNPGSPSIWSARLQTAS